MIKSKIKGVHYSATIGKWMARTQGKRQLYRGDSMQEAEMARLKYDIGHATIQPQSKPRKMTQKYRQAFNPFWPATPASYGLELADEQ